MGYEITFTYYEKEDGRFDMDPSKAKTLTKNVGRRNAEVSEEQVAAVILGQFANRDIYVTNVEIFEYTKRPVSFKEAKGGVVIRGKKFAFDQLASALKADDCTETSTPSPIPMPTLRRESEMPDLRSDSTDYDMSEFSDLSQFKPSMPAEQPIQMPQFNPALAQQKVNTKPKRDPNVPIRNEVFRPSREVYPMLQRQGIKLTMNKPYALFGEVMKNAMEPVYYVVQDDTGNKIEVSSLHFEPMRRGLVGIGMNDPQMPHQSEGRLSYVDYGSGVSHGGGDMGSGGGSMPVLRRGF
jgi:hypothetical protein